MTGEPDGGRGRGFFPPTRWSVVAAARSADEGERERALETLAAAYWRPVYRHVRLKWGRGHEEAADLTQDFFVELFERGLLARFDPSRARLRTYLRLCVDGLVANAAKAGTRLKRGGGARPLSLDLDAVRAEWESAASGGDAPDRAFEKEWARSVLSLAVERLRDGLAARGRETAFEIFSACDLGEGGVATPTYAELAERFGVKVTDVTNSLAAARRELRVHVLDLLRELTGNEEELRLEARALLGTELPDPPP